MKPSILRRKVARRNAVQSLGIVAVGRRSAVDTVRCGKSRRVVVARVGAARDGPLKHDRRFSARAPLRARDRDKWLRRAPDLDCPSVQPFDADDKEIGTYPTMDEAATALLGGCPCFAIVTRKYFAATRRAASPHSF
jgi:hypothetical protein